MSLGIAPELKAVREAQASATFTEQYKDRRRLLGRKLSIEPIPDHVTYFPDHPYNRGKAGSMNRMVDVVSCVAILAGAGQKMPKSFLKLQPKLQELALPNNSQIQVGLGAFHALAQEVIKKPKKDQSGRNASVEIDNLNALIFAMARGGYGYKHEAGVKEREKVVADILVDVKAAGVSGYGLSTLDSIHKKLIEAASGRNGEG
ncbi:hypothetical protein RCH10_001217 [Variovorax sp. GrIS 2.14]|uniref:hypothetical protein n=1 Tax=Variovorax sp. GrIS 2.14 TaxID=3071709 RepID=UPI0038F6F87E